MEQADVRHVDVGHRMDTMPLAALHLATLALCTVGFAFDLFEMAMGNVLSAVFSAPGSGVGAAELSWLLASVYLGAIVGAPVLGSLADRVGRQRVLVAALLWLAATSTWAALSANVQQLVWARVLSGVALGAYPPLMMSYLTDLLPTRRRGPLVLWACGLGALGLPAGVFLVRSLGGTEPLGLEPWRFAFLVGSVGSGLVGLLMLRLPESPRWLQSRDRSAQAEAACQRFERSRPLLAGSGPAAGPRASAPADAAGATPPWRGIHALFFLSAWGTVAFPLLMGTVLTARGFNLSDALLYVGLSTFGPALGSLASSFVVDRVDRRLAMGVCAATLVGAGAVFMLSGARPWLAAAAVVFGIASILYTTAINLYATELFPTRSRARGTATAWAFNRLGAALGLLGLLPLLKQQGPAAMFGVIAGSLVLSILLLLVAPKGRERQAVA